MMPNFNELLLTGQNLQQLFLFSWV